MVNKTGIIVALSATAFLSQCGCNELPLPPDHNAIRQENAALMHGVSLPKANHQVGTIQIDDALETNEAHAFQVEGKVLIPLPQTAIVSHAFPAKVMEIHVDVGDWVEMGAPLITLESLDVGEAKSEYCKAITTSELAKVNFARQKRLLEDGIGAKKNFLTAEAEQRVAQLDLKAAETRLQVMGFGASQRDEIAAHMQISPTVVLDAPLAGKIVEIDAVSGAMTDESTQLMRIIDPRLLCVDVEIDEEQIAEVKIGQKVEVSVPAYPEEILVGEVSRIADVAHKTTQSVTVTSRVDNAEQLLKPDMTAHVAILLEQP